MEGSNSSFKKSLLISLACLAGSIFFAVKQGWSVREFCWSTWVCSLSFSWLCVLFGYSHLLFKLKSEGEKLGASVAVEFIRRPFVASLLVFTGGTIAAAAAAVIYMNLYSFYGLFLSVFAEMKPLELFGKNGFINSDFFTPVAFLAKRFWPMMIFTAVSGLRPLLGPDPWSKMIMPFRSREIVRIHVMTVALPFLSVIFWMIFRERYNTPAVIALLAIFFLFSLPSRRREKGAC